MSTLPTLLNQRVLADGSRVALSFKERGVWRRLEWSRVELEVRSLRSALGNAGFGAGALLIVSDQASARAVLAALAALSLGGIVAGLDALTLPSTPSSPLWAFARNSTELARLLEARFPGALSGVLFDDQHGPSSEQVVVPVLNYSALVSATPSEAAPVRSTERCVLELGLASGAATQQLLASWVAQGFELGIPEGNASVERDAGELGVSLRIASSRSWDAWGHALRTRLAAPGSRKRRFVEWALAVGAAPFTRPRWARWLSALLVVLPLRRALRLSHWRRAVALNAAPAPETTALLRGLGVRLEPWHGERLIAFEESQESTAIDPSSNVGELTRQSA